MTIPELDFSSSLDISPESLMKQAGEARDLLESRKCPGNEFLGWMDLPERISKSSLEDLQNAAKEIQKSESLVVIGIGGSYLGARAVIEAIRSPFAPGFPVYFAGHQMDSFYHSELLRLLSGRRFSVNVISKSGTTTEPGLAFRLFWNDLKKHFGPEDLRRLVFATTDEKKGSLRKLCDSAGLKSFTIPDDVGGRFSVLTPVGLLPVAAAGLNAVSLMDGAREMMNAVRGKNRLPDNKNPALLYAAYRNAAYAKGKKIELLTSYQSGLHYLAEWWKQLFGESEGKKGKGIFPAAADFTSDLHSMGQWIQDGERSIFQTVLDVKSGAILPVPTAESDDDGLKYLEGRPLHEINRTALQATVKAHSDGGVPCLRIVLDKITEQDLGAYIYMMEYACAVSALMLGVNPFDQPGVEDYKNNMFRMLGKPGYAG